MYGASGVRIQSNFTVAQNDVLHLVVGGIGSSALGGHNGGGSIQFGSYAGGGGGATDIRIGSVNLTSRLLVAAGGAGGTNKGCASIGWSTYGGDGGALEGLAGRMCQLNPPGNGAIQTAGGYCGTVGSCQGYLGKGGQGSSWGGGGGGGYYGGGGGYMSGGGGGSSYVAPAYYGNTVVTAGYNTGNGYLKLIARRTGTHYYL